MCGRFALDATPQQIQQEFNLSALPVVQARYNIAPSQPVALIANDEPGTLTHHRWGLIPPWAKDPIIGNQMINARAETAHEKPSFKNALRRRRCLIPATGFYEWPRKGKPPVYIHLPDKPLFAFAGLWERWNSPQGDEIRTCTILTTEPNDAIRPFHHRMALILPPEHYALWLSADELTPDQLMPLMTPHVHQYAMAAYEVSTRVNSPANDSPECIQPLQPPGQPSLL